jgi:hypothetical protein
MKINTDYLLKVLLAVLCLIIVSFLAGVDDGMRKQEEKMAEQYTPLQKYCKSPGHNETMCAGMGE